MYRNPATELCKKLRQKIRLLTRDVEDLKGSHRTSFTRCEKCERYHDAQLICPRCGTDSEEVK